MKREIRVYLGLKTAALDQLKWWQLGVADGELTVHVYGQRFGCGKTGHRKSECWRNDEKLARSPSPTESGKGKSGKKGAGNGKRKSEPAKRKPEQYQFFEI